MYTPVSYTHLPADMIRPAYNPDVTDDEVLSNFEDPQNTDKEYKEWFDGNIIWSYFDSQYPWTRLGYTCLLYTSKKELTNKKQSDMISELHLRDEKATKQRNNKEP